LPKNTCIGTGKHYRLISANAVHTQIEEQKAQANPFFHSFTGCDTTSAFATRGKKAAWDLWAVLEEVKEVFKDLLGNTDCITPEHYAKLEHFVVLLYSRTVEETTVNMARQKLFSSTTKSLDKIPPTQGALVEHIKRSAYQSAIIWGQTLSPEPQSHSPGEWGWKQVNGEWVPFWSALPEACKACKELIRCGCKVACRGNCKCFKTNLPCTDLCFCCNSCSRQDV